jgi:hypothetical protein
VNAGGALPTETVGGIRAVPKAVREFARELDEDLRKAGYGPFMTRDEVGKALGYCMRTIERYARAGALTPMRLRKRGRPLYRRHEIALLLASRK